MHVPNGEDRSMLLVSDVLEMASIQQGEPRALTGDVGFENPVRWVHIAAGSDVASLLAGGELILTTGVGWPRDSASLLAEVNELLQAGISALFIERGKRFTEIPNDLIELCRQRRVPVIELNRETSFVRVTEQVHRAILQEQAEAIEARDEVQAMLTRLGLNRAPIDYVVQQLAATLDATVVLENTLGEVTSWSPATGEVRAVEALAAWPRNPGAPLADGWDSVSVEARDARWGQLIAQAGPPHPAGRRTVLELGAIALALGRLADPLDRPDRWVSTHAKQVFDDLLEGRYTSDNEAQAHLRARGIDLDERAVHAVSLRTGVTPGVSVDSQVDNLLSALERALPQKSKLITAIQVDADISVLAFLSIPPGDIDLEERLSRRFDTELRAHGETPPPARVHVMLGPEATSIRELVASIELVTRADYFASTTEYGSVSLSVVARAPLAYFVNELRNDERLNRFAEGVLAPLLEYDRMHSADLVRVLDAYVRNPTNRSQAALAANLSRSVFYQRLDLIEQVLDVDLSDGTVIATVLLALQAIPRANHRIER